MSRPEQLARQNAQLHGILDVYAHALAERIDRGAFPYRVQPAADTRQTG